MKTDTVRDPNRVFLEARHLITEALEKGVRDALLRHKERGQPVVIERYGKIVWVSAEDLLDA